MQRRRRTTRRGFTLIESIAAIVVLGTLGSIASFLIVGAVDGFVEASNAAQLHAELSIGLDRAVREMRRIEPAPGGNGASRVDSVTATSIGWSDSDGDAYALSLAGTEVTIAVDGGAAAVLLSDVAAFTVTASDEDDSPLTPPCSGAGCSAVRRVRLEATLQRNGVTHTLRAKVFLRGSMAGTG
jgi:prepilin-type N-terminal cleavage/methylation domain-containing protein